MTNPIEAPALEACRAAWNAEAPVIRAEAARVANALVDGQAVEVAEPRVWRLAALILAARVGS